MYELSKVCPTWMGEWLIVGSTNKTHPSRFSDPVLARRGTWIPLRKENAQWKNCLCGWGCWKVWIVGGRMLWLLDYSLWERRRSLTIYSINHQTPPLAPFKLPQLCHDLFLDRANTCEPSNMCLPDEWSIPKPNRPRKDIVAQLGRMSAEPMGISCTQASKGTDGF